MSLQNMVVNWTKTALVNLDLIAEYIAKDSPVRAHSFVLEIQQKTKIIEEFPGAGRAGRVAGTRELVAHKNYILAYRVKGENIEIIRVHHVAQKYPVRTK
jgi:addiction module RelE/StbE family toxin